MTTNKQRMALCRKKELKPGAKKKKGIPGIREYIIRLRLTTKVDNNCKRHQLGKATSWAWQTLLENQRVIFSDERVVCLESPRMKLRRKQESINAAARKRVKANALRRRRERARQLKATAVAAETYGLLHGTTHECNRPGANN